MFSLIPVLFGMTIVVFLIIRAIPGDPAQVILGQQATKEAVAALTKELGLDNPWHIQYIDYVKQLLSGDLGTSLRTRAPINQELWPYLAATMELTLVAMIIAVVIGVNAGIISAWYSNSWFDYVAMVFALIGVSMPIFWLGFDGTMDFFHQFRVAPVDGSRRSAGPCYSDYELVFN